MRTRTHLGLSLATLLLCGCSRRPPTAIVLALSSELRSPQDADELRIRVLRGTEERLSRTYALDGRSFLPGTLALSSDDDEDDTRPLLVQTQLGRAGAAAPLVSRDARLSLLPKQTKVLRLRFSVACVGKVCEPGTTCDQGECISQDVDAETLPDFESDAAALSPPGCFDEQRCLLALAQASVDTTSCSFAAPGPAGRFNVAIAWRAAPDHPVILNPVSGWNQSSGTVTLAPFVCEALTQGTADAVYTSLDCDTKDPRAAVCAASPGSPGGAGGAGAATAGNAGSGGAAGGQGGQSGQGGLSGQSGKAGMAGQSGMAGMAGQSGMAGQAGQAGQAGMAGMAGQAGMGPGGAGAGGVGGGGAGQGGDAGASGAGAAGSAGAAGEAGAAGMGGGGGAAPSSVAGVSTGARETCAWSVGGKVACWGVNYGFVVGSPNYYSPSPVPIAGISDAGSVVVGLAAYGCARAVGGAVSCWGAEPSFCNGSACEATPTPVTGAEESEQLVGLNDVACILRKSGDVACWGKNAYGALGDGTQNESPVPKVVQLGMPATAIYGRHHGCAKLLDGSVTCWGANSPAPQPIVGVSNPREVRGTVSSDLLFLMESGEMYLAPMTDSGWGAASSVGTPISGIVSMDVWDTNIAVLDKSGDVWTGTVPQLEFTKVDLGAKASGVSVGRDGFYQGTFCAPLLGGGLSCFGGNRFGELGNGKKDAALVPEQVAFAGKAASLLSASESTVIVDDKGKVFGCGASAIDAAGSTPGPSSISELGSGVASVFPFESDTAYARGGAGLFFIKDQQATSNAMTMLSPGVVSSLGTYDLGLKDGQIHVLSHSAAANEDGAFGDGTTTTPAMAVDSLVMVEGLPTVASFSSGVDLDGVYRTQCALDTVGKIACWGDNVLGQVGVTPGPPVTTPVSPDFPDPTTVFKAIASGAQHSCALSQAGDVYCWGDGSNGKVGQGTNVDKAPPQKLAGLPGIDGIGCGAYHCCAWQGPSLWCWGPNMFGEVGVGSLDAQGTPALVKVFGANVVETSLVGRGQTTCVRLENGELWCWGDSYAGEGCLGRAGRNMPPTAVAPFQ
jgi:alpha-tubulin suppressor-like RCC1 family protein